MGKKVDAHVLFNLTLVNHGQLPIKMNVELDVNFLELKVPNVGFLILEEPNRILEREHHTEHPGIIGWNLICLTYKVYGKYG